MAGEPKTVSIDDVVSKLSQMPPEQQQQILAQMPEEARNQVLAYAQGKPQGAPKQESPKKAKAPSKSISETVGDLEKKGMTLAQNIDGFVGDFARTGATSYMLAISLPIALTGVTGLASLAILGSTTYVGTNLVYKLLTGSTKFAYGTFTNPLKRVKSVTKFLANFVANPLTYIKLAFTLPDKLYESLFEGGNHNKYGKMLGAIVGGGFAANQLMPNALSGLDGGRIDGLLAPIKKGAYALTDKVFEAASAAKAGASKLYYDYWLVKDPLGSAGSGLGLALDKALVYK